MKLLRLDGSFVAKVFCKGSIPLLQMQMEMVFADVCFHKPPASRASSYGMYNDMIVRANFANRADLIISES